MTFSIEEKIKNSDQKVNKLMGQFIELKTIIEVFKTLFEYKFKQPLSIIHKPSAIEITLDGITLVKLECNNAHLYTLLSTTFFSRSKVKNPNKKETYDFLNSILLCDLIEKFLFLDNNNNNNDETFIQSLKKTTLSNEEIECSIEQLNIINFLLEDPNKIIELRSVFYEEWYLFLKAFRNSSTDIDYPDFFYFSEFFFKNRGTNSSPKESIQLFLKQHIRNQKLELEDVLTFRLSDNKEMVDNIYSKDLELYSDSTILARKENMKKFICYFKTYLENMFDIKLIILSEYFFKIQGRKHEDFIFGFSDIQYFKHYEFFSLNLNGKLEDNFNYDDAIRHILETTNIINYLVFNKTFN